MLRAMFDFTPAWPHGPLQLAFPGVHFVVGTNKTHHAGTDFQTSRTMTVLQEGDALTLVNTVRLTDPGLAELEALGRVRHVVRLGAFHGRDDPFYRERYGATTWALPGALGVDGRSADAELGPDLPFPALAGRTFVFTSAALPEAAVLLPREGGILLTCDAVQSWSRVDPFFSQETGAAFVAQGLIGPANVPSTWLGACQPGVADFERLLELPFRHLLSAHGEPLRGEARQRLGESVARAFPR